MTTREVNRLSTLMAQKHWRPERTFFLGMAATCVAAIFLGFAPTYYLKTIYGTPALPRVVHLHGLLFTSWIVLLATQTALVAVGRTDLHRRLGIGGAALAGAMTLVAFVTAIGAVQRGSQSVEFFAVPMGSVVVFPALVGAALVVRRQPAAHKRLMLIATAELLVAGVARWPIVREWGALGFFGVTNLLVIAPILVYDLVTRRRPHPATVWGGLFFVASQPLRIAIGGTDLWLTFSRWLIG
jgi:hypothetical protein